jgi:hypothetical protein
MNKINRSSDSEGQTKLFKELKIRTDIILNNKTNLYFLHPNRKI